MRLTTGLGVPEYGDASHVHDEESLDRLALDGAGNYPVELPGARTLIELITR